MANSNPPLGRDTVDDSNLHVLHSKDPEKTEIRHDGLLSVSSITHIEPASAEESSPLPASPGNTPSPDSVDSLVGQNLDHYRIESLVGVGGMGAVFRGRDQRLDRIVAIKVVPISNRRADAMRRFRMEAQSAAKLDHPNIARVYYVGETERWSYIVFEFIEGTNLRQLVLEHGLLTVDDATHFICQVAEALQHAHDRGVVHRDIKPSNILIGTDGKAKLVDMGLARTTELDRSTGDLTASGVTLGTFDYISPEQAHDPRDADVRSDIYSLGCTLYFLLTGQPPFPDGTALQKLLMHGTKMPEDPRFFRNDLSDSLIEILRKMMAKKPKDRYQTPNDLVNDLRTLAVIDSLSWSQDFNDEVLASSQSKRPWWESAMPSLVSLLLIALSTMWLYNANQLSAIFSIPQVEFVDPSPDSNLEIASVASSSNLASDNTDSADAKLRSNAEPRNRPGNEGNESSGRSASDPSDESNPAGESTLDKTVVIGKPGTIYGIDMDDSYLSATSLDEALSLVIT
ncbi:MAG: serine/threonine-protein kinase, partial [Pirellula sp.]